MGQPEALRPDADEAAYLEGRAEQELELAQRAVDPRVVAAHYDMACRYLERLYPKKVVDGKPGRTDRC